MAAPVAAVPILDAAIMHEKKSAKAETIEVALESSSAIRIVDPSEYREAAQCLAEAFGDDHCIRYPIDTPDRSHWTEEQKWKLHVETLEYVTYAHCLNGVVTTVGPNYDCVALWMPPGKNMDDLFTILRSGMWRLSYRLSAQGRQRFFTEFLPLLGRTKKAVLGPRDNDSYYLVYIGTKVGSRGRGYAKKLVNHMTAQADREGKASYLESSHAVNLAIYKKLGFEPVEKIYLEEDKEGSMDIMVREPRVTKVMEKGM